MSNTKPTPRDSRRPTAGEGPGRFAYEGLSRVIHERARLSIMTSLATHPRGLLFNDLRELCALTDGNLNRHLAVLEEHKLVEVWKNLQNRRPQTLCRITALGRERLVDYLGELERVLDDAVIAEKRWSAEAGPGSDSQPLNPKLRPA